MSFFDETDDEPRRAPRTQQRRPRPPGRGRPPRDHQSIQTRRTVAVVGVVVVVVVMALLIHSCQVSARNSSLKDYNNSVSALIQRSYDTSKQLFSTLKSGVSASTDLATTLKNAQNQLSDAEALSAPSEMTVAQTNLVLAMKMRRDGISIIAHKIQPAVGKTDSKDAISAIASAMARFYASDVVYKAYAAPAIAGALNNARIPLGGTNGETINPEQFLPDLGWLQTGFIDTEFGASASSGGQNSTAPGLHGHKLNTVSVGSTTLSPTATNALQRTPAPTFDLNLTNGGAFNQFNVSCTVSVSGLSDTGTAKIAETTPGQTTDCLVKLPTPPTAGTYTVTATVGPVPGEANKANNTLSFPVTFS